MEDLEILPTDLQNIIHKYIHNIKMANVLKEMEEHFYICCNCDYLENDCINPKYTNCDYCKNPICSTCEETHCITDPDEEVCDDCFFENMIMGSVERIIGRNYEDDEFVIMTELICDIITDGKEEIAEYILDVFAEFVHEDALILPFHIMYDIIEDYIYN